MATIVRQSTISVTDVVADSDGVPIDVRGGDTFSIQAVIDENTDAAKNFLSGYNQEETLTFDTKANTDPGDYVVIYDSLGLAWAVAADLDGDDPEPTGEVWDSIPAARKGQADLTSANTAANVAAAFELAFDALASVPFSTDDSAADGTMVVIITARALCADPEVFNEDDSGAGSILASIDSPGIPSSVDIDANSITLESHGLPTGMKGQLTTTGTLPAGLSLLTDYYIISVDANTFKFATSYALALLGTAVNLTNQGSNGGENIFTPTPLSGASIKFQKSNDAIHWTDLDEEEEITVDTSVWLEQSSYSYSWVRAILTVDEGSISVDLKLLVKSIYRVPPT